MPNAKPPTGKTWKILNGINYRPYGDPDAEEVRREIGDVADDLPPKALKWLLEREYVEEVV